MSVLKKHNHELELDKLSYNVEDESHRKSWRVSCGDIALTVNDRPLVSKPVGRTKCNFDALTATDQTVLHLLLTKLQPSIKIEIPKKSVSKRLSGLKRTPTKERDEELKKKKKCWDDNVECLKVVLGEDDYYTERHEQDLR